MTVKQFRTLSGNKGRFVSIPVDSIRLVSDIHKKKPADASKINKPYKNLLVIVHKNKDDTYDLITGWRDYIIAVRDGVKEIKAILVKETTRDDFIHSLSDSVDWITLDRIVVPSCFENNQPNKEKLDFYINQVKTAVENYALSDYLEIKPITVDDKNILVNGYTRYLALQKLGYKQKIPVLRKD